MSAKEIKNDGSNSENNLTRIYSIIQELGISQIAFAKNAGLDPSTINRFVKGHRNPDVYHATAINEKYPEYSIEYITGSTDEKLDDASIILAALKKAYIEFKTTPKKDFNTEGNLIETRYLRFILDEHLLMFLKEIDRANRIKQSQGLESYQEEISIIKQKYLNEKGKGASVDCVLIPKNVVFEIISSNQNAEKTLDELVNLGTRIEDYFDNE